MESHCLPLTWRSRKSCSARNGENQWWNKQRARWINRSGNKENRSFCINISWSSAMFHSCPPQQHSCSELLWSSQVLGQFHLFLSAQVGVRTQPNKVCCFRNCVKFSCPCFSFAPTSQYAVGCSRELAIHSNRPLQIFHIRYLLDTESTCWKLDNDRRGKTVPVAH